MGGNGLQRIQRVKLASMHLPALDYAPAIGQPMRSPAVVSGASRAASLVRELAALRAADVSMVAPSAPRDARSKTPPGPEGSNGIDRRGRRGQPAGPSPFPATPALAGATPGWRPSPDMARSYRASGVPWWNTMRHPSRAGATASCAAPSLAAGRRGNGGCDNALGQTVGQQPHRVLFRFDQHLRALQRDLLQGCITAVALPGTADLAEILVQQCVKALRIGPHRRRMQRALQHLQSGGQRRVGGLAGTAHGGSCASTCGAVGVASGTHCPGCATRWPRAASATPSATLA